VGNIEIPARRAWYRFIQEDDGRTPIAGKRIYIAVPHDVWGEYDTGSLHNSADLQHGPIEAQFPMVTAQLSRCLNLLRIGRLLSRNVERREPVGAT